MITVDPVNLTRMAGAGNTFFIVNNLSAPASIEASVSAQRALKARRTCNDFVGTSTDGLIFLEAHADFDFVWDFYNADGSSAEMCGNAARCVALYFFHKVKPQDKISFLSKAGPIEAEIVDAQLGIVKVKMPKIKDVNPKIQIQKGDQKIRGYLVDTGVPHLVIQGEPDLQMARHLRKAPELGPRGANVTFAETDETDFIQAVTFERGVEGFTLACGTGAVAAAKFHHDVHPQIKTQTIEMPGGLLQVDWDQDTPYLTGAAEFHFDLQLYGDPL